MAGSLTPQKSGAALLTCQTLDNAAILKSTPVDVSGKWGATVFVRHGRLTTTSLTGAIEYRIEGSANAHGGNNDMWVPIFAWTTANHNTAAVAPTLETTQAANATTFSVSSGTGITAADSLLFMYDATTVGNSEWTRIVSISTKTVTVSDSLTRAHSLTSTQVTDQAEEWAIPVDLSAHRSIRLVADAAKNSTAVKTCVEADIVYHDATYYS